jgi:hypothetical protein
MAISTAQVTVGASAVKLVDGPGTVFLVYDTISNSGTTWIGDSTVTVATGFHLYSSISFDHQFHLGSGQSLWGISTGSDVIDVLKFS